MDHLRTAVRQEAMLALADMSQVEMALGGMKESLLEACFRSVFLLPPKTDMQGLDSSLYFDTLDAMDILLQSLVLSSPGCGELKSILQVRHWQRVGFAGAVAHPGGTGVSTLEWTVSSPAPRTQHTAGRVLSSPGGPRHGPPCSSRSSVTLAAVSVISPLQPPSVPWQSPAHGTFGPAPSPELSSHQRSGKH
ncbi:maestro heat-like repeat-containing protein family member 7 isoform X2 [Neopsephotus bourkii]|uniref:maestro heat-like repeat-containing protein family member 7 isoform X2 n=2 Tax=Neopsephotus bourkii TaxID=309878 RepID=UPI002AA5A29B|nr:maestro heat-like repeat-containing protein family member 7 isoform X2 [Neopsephotus bourkii]XP_061225254.1 maestro heat-like repeat-containing protein family member 7 isoform X2 [Neopsephotus bourkii]